MQLSTGVRIGSFEVIGPLGAGGMGALYRARDGRLNRDVAIKILQEKLSDNREYLLRFEREARAASALNHPNIVTIFEIDEFEGAPFIAMELIDGISLRELLRKGPLPLRKLLDIAVQIAEGLAAAHERGIVHRDLKPENVMVTKDGRVKIVDFGLARIHRPADEDSHTTSLTSVHTPVGRVLGTASYVSPEQARGEQSLDYRSDQFSFGSILYELATGRRAFTRDNTIDTLNAIAHEEPQAIALLNPKIPAQLCWTIERCLAKEPDERYASTRDLAHELRTLRDHLPETSPGRVAVPVAVGPRPWFAVAGASILVLIAVIAIATWWHPWRTFTPPLPNQKYLAVLPFTDLSGKPDGQLFSQGFAAAVSAKLGRYSGMQVIPPASSAALVAKKSDLRRIGEELGATLILNGSVQRVGEQLRVSYTIVDPARGTQVAGDTVDGAITNIWTVQDEIATAVATDLRLAQPVTPTQPVGLETADEQDMYVRALGSLEQADDEKSIDGALDLLHQLTETAAASPLVQAALARAYLAKYSLTHDKSWSDKAIRASDRAFARDPGAADVVLTRADVERTTGRYEDAIRTYMRTLSIRPNFPEAAIGLARAEQAANQFDNAERDFRRGIALRPTWWYGFHYLGFLYFAHGKYDDASKAFQQVVRLNPHNAWGYVDLGALDIMNGKFEDAIAMYTKAIELRPDADALSNLAVCYYSLGQYDKAAETDRKAITLRPSMAIYWANFADACRWTPACRQEVSNAYKKAIDLSTAELAVNDNNPRAHATIAISSAGIGSLGDADMHMNRALQLDPNNPTRMYQAARVANARNDTAAAVLWLSRAVAAGYEASAVERDPEFERLRTSQRFQAAFKTNGSG